MTRRRRLVAGRCCLPLLLGAAAQRRRAVAEPLPPIVFVHGNGDTAALWQTTIWRFESNGWPRERLHAIDLPYPLARDDDDKPQPGRTLDRRAHALSRRPRSTRCCRRPARDKVVLFGSSRGGNAIRNYIANGGGASAVSHAVLGGAPNHGVWDDPDVPARQRVQRRRPVPDGAERAAGAERRRGHAGHRAG